MSVNIWLIGGSIKSTRSIKKRLREEWGLTVTGHWPTGEGKFKSTSGNPQHALVLKENCQHRQKEWVEAHHPSVRVTETSGTSWAHMTKDLVKLGFSPVTAKVEDDAMIVGVKNAAAALGITFYRVNAALQRVLIGKVTSLIPLKKATGRGGHNAHFWANEEALQKWWSRVKVDDPTVFKSTQIVGVKGAGEILSLSTKRICRAIDWAKRIEPKLLPKKTKNRQWEWYSEDDLKEWWQTCSDAQVLREEEARKKQRQGIPVTNTVMMPAPTAFIMPDAPEPLDSDLEDEIILAVNEEQKDLVRALVKRLDTPEVRFLLGKPPSAEDLYQKALTRGLEALREDLG